MDVTEIIDQVLSHTDNIGASDSENVDRRERVLEYLREILAEVWFRRDWTFTKKTGGASVTVPALQGWVEVPADYSKLGTFGAVHHSQANGGAVLDWVPEHLIQEIRQRGTTDDLPKIFSIFGMSASFREQIQLPLNTRDLELHVYYHTLPPTIDEGANVDEIKRVPERFHQTVLVPGVRYLTRRSKGDNRAQEDEAKMEKGIDSMAAEERRFQGTIRRLPSFFGR